MSLEREVKLGAEPDFALPDLTGALPGAVVSVEAPRWLRATYWDTADLRLARAGVTVRHRTGEEGEGSPGGGPTGEGPPGGGGGWTVKLPGDAKAGDAKPGGLLSRREIDFEGGPEAVPSPVAGLVRALVRTADLVPVARLRTRRVSLELRDATGRRVAQVDDDEVTVDEAMGEIEDRRPGRFREVEVELAPDTSQAVARAVVGRLVEAGASRSDPVPKAIRALGSAARVAPEVTATQVDAKASGGALVRAAVGAGTSCLLRHDPGVRLGCASAPLAGPGDRPHDTAGPLALAQVGGWPQAPEDVHQARVATRRLRSDLATFSLLVDSSWIRNLRHELAWLGDALGSVRDADVLLDQLRADARQLGEIDHQPAAHLLVTLEADRCRAQRTLGEVLDSPRYLALLDSLVDAANVPCLTPLAETPAARLAPELVEAAWSRLAGAIDGLGDAPSDEALHRVRIKAKRCRYAAEAVAPVVGKAAARLARRVAALQGVLGELHDAVVAERRLREMVAAPGVPLTPAQAAVAGALMEAQRRRAAERRRQWQKVWRKASKPKVHAWLR